MNRLSAGPFVLLFVFCFLVVLSASALTVCSSCDCCFSDKLIKELMAGAFDQDEVEEEKEEKVRRGR